MTPADLTTTHVETLVEALAMSADFMSLPHPYKTQEEQETFRLSASLCREIQASLTAADDRLTLTEGRVAMMRAALTWA